MMDASAKAGLGAVHGISHSTGAHLNIAHGRVNSILLPEIIEFNAGTAKYECDAQQETVERYAQLANILQNTDKFSGKSDAETFANMVRDLEDQLPL